MSALLCLLLFVSTALVCFIIYSSEVVTRVMCSPLERNHDSEPKPPTDWNGDDNILMEKYLFPYYRALSSGMTHWDITEKVFNVTYLRKDEVFPHSYPLISGHTFRAMADVIYMHEFKINRSNPKHSPWLHHWTVHYKSGNTNYIHKDGEILWVETNKVREFAHTILLGLPNVKFVLISNGDDCAAPCGGEKVLSDPRLIMWFSLNIDRLHPKMQLIPVGLKSTWHDKLAYNPKTIIPFIIGAPPFYDPDDVKEGHLDRRHILVYNNFNMFHSKSRRKAYDVTKGLGGVNTLKMANILTYYATVMQSKFMTSPIGYGMDCFRTWEAVAFGAIPIVQNSTLNPLHEQAPVLIVDRWDKSVITREFLLKHKVKTKSRLIITADYWFQKINDARKEYL